MSFTETDNRDKERLTDKRKHGGTWEVVWCRLEEVGTVSVKSQADDDDDFLSTTISNLRRSGRTDRFPCNNELIYCCSHVSHVE